MDSQTHIHVLVGIVETADGNILVARRLDTENSKQDSAEVWEFPGGKKHQGESRFDALSRELKEEVGIEVVRAWPLKKFLHRVNKRNLLLDFWRVSDWINDPWEAEGQPIKWVHKTDLDRLNMLPANRSIVKSLRLPHHYLITPPVTVAPKLYLTQLRKSIEALKNINVAETSPQNSQLSSLVQFRSNNLNENEYKEMAGLVIDLCHQRNACCILNTSLEIAESLNADGIHLNSHRLWQFDQRCLATNKILTVACHNQADLIQAERIDADIATIGPVKSTTSHPNAIPIGWSGLLQFSSKTSIGLYALGGMAKTDLAQARKTGAMGIAGITTYWVYD